MKEVGTIVYEGNEMTRLMPDTAIENMLCINLFNLALSTLPQFKLEADKDDTTGILRNHFYSTGSLEEDMPYFIRGEKHSMQMFFANDGSGSLELMAEIDTGEILCFDNCSRLWHSNTKGVIWR